MKIWSITLGLVLASMGSLLAQISVEVQMAQDQFLPGETIPVTVRIANRSGRTLKLGNEEDWLTFGIQERKGTIIGKKGEVPVLGEFTLESSKVAIKKVDLAPSFELNRPGRYNVTATVRIREWDSVASSPPKGFDLINGNKIWVQDFGLPATDSANQPPEVRRFALLHANYLKSGLRLYFRLTEEPSGKVLKVFSLGEIVSFGHPQAEVDAQSRLHVLYQNGARTSRYTMITSSGEVELRQLYKYEGGKPSMVVGSDGKITVNGAVRVPDDNDIPAPKPPE